MTIGPEEVQAIFEQEFGMLREHFYPLLTFASPEAESTQDPRVVRGGVYVWLRDGKAYRVGRSLTNTRKRAVQHVHDDTAGIMASFHNDAKATLLLFNVRDDQKLHWAFALEDFLEQTLKPVIPSGRRG